MTRSQLRYQRYLEMEDCFNNFKDFLKYYQSAAAVGIFKNNI